MLMKKTPLTIGILLIVCTFLVILANSASAQPLSCSIKTLRIDYDTAIKKANEFYAKQGMVPKSYEGTARPFKLTKASSKSKLIFGANKNVSCVIGIYQFKLKDITTRDFSRYLDVAFIAVASNNRNAARDMRDKILKHMTSKSKAVRVISPHSASSQPLTLYIKTLEIPINTATKKANEFYAKQGMVPKSYEGTAPGGAPVPLIFGTSKNVTCVIGLYGFKIPVGHGYYATIAFIAATSNNEYAARDMRDMILEHMTSMEKVT